MNNTVEMNSNLIEENDTNEKKLKKKSKYKSKLSKIKEQRQLYLLLLPAFILTIVFKYIPMYGILIGLKITTRYMELQVVNG